VVASSKPLLPLRERCRDSERQHHYHQAATVNTTRMRFFMRYPLSLRAGLITPPKSADARTLASSDEFPINSWLTSENSVERKAVPRLLRLVCDNLTGCDLGWVRHQGS
jgi:hypothetical protein